MVSAATVGPGAHDAAPRAAEEGAASGVASCLYFFLMVLPARSLPSLKRKVSNSATRFHDQRSRMHSLTNSSSASGVRSKRSYLRLARASTPRPPGLQARST